MAVKDVKQYYYAMLAQYIEMKADLADFEQALADGFITEEQLEAIREDVLRVENNYERLSYIMYLLEMPNKKSKKVKYAKTNKKLLAFFDAADATQGIVEDENRDTLNHLRTELKKLKK